MKRQAILLFLFALSLETVQSSVETLYSKASLADLTCAATEEVFVADSSSLLQCLTKCTDMESCKSVAYGSGWCRGCSLWHSNSTGLESRSGTKLYNKATGIANYDEDCSINPCLKPNQKCDFDYDTLTMKCTCKLGSSVTGTSVCEKNYALNLESCASLPCYGDNDVRCTQGTQICECINGATYFPDNGQCLVADVPYQQNCESKACMEPRQICNDDLCVCDHGYKYNSSIMQCVTECGSYGNTFQLYPQWKILWNDLEFHAFTDDEGCKTHCENNPACRSITVVQVTLVYSCYLHDITALTALPFWEYQYDILITHRHYVRNCG